MVLLVVFAAVVVLAFVGLYVWTRRSERDIEIPEQVLTEEQKQQRTVAGGVISSIVAGQAGGGGIG